MQSTEQSNSKEKKSNLYTKTGDLGFTSVKGSRVLKNSIIIQTCGKIDELHVRVGDIVSNLSKLQRKEDINLIRLLERICVQTLQLGSRVYSCLTDSVTITANSLQNLEEWIDYLDSQCPKQTQFLVFINIHPLVIKCHEARIVVRELERTWISLIYFLKDISVDSMLDDVTYSNKEEKHKEDEKDLDYAFLNRLSDFFYIFARYLQTQVFELTETFRNEYDESLPIPSLSIKNPFPSK
jgi:ATP:cob(I)alamin adenosyltransferase